MKKHLIWLSFIFLLCSSAIYDTKESNRQKSVNKNISLAIYKSIDYSSSVYNDAAVQLQIRIEKVSGKKHTALWDTTYNPQLLRTYPTLVDASTQTLTVEDVQDSKEHLEVICTRTYYSKGYKLQIENCSVIGEQSGNRLDISI